MRPYATSLPGAALLNGFCPSVTESWLPAFSLHLLPSQSWQTSSVIWENTGPALLYPKAAACSTTWGAGVLMMAMGNLFPLWCHSYPPEASIPSWHIGCHVLPGSWSLQRDHTHDKGLSSIRAQWAFVSLCPETLIQAPGERPLNVPSLLHNTA